MAVESLNLITNPGSASRKYALYHGRTLRAHLHFEYENSKVVCTLTEGKENRRIDVQIGAVDDAAGQVVDILKQQGVLHEGEEITKIGLRVVAPGVYFLQHHVVDDEFMRHFRQMEQRVPLHAKATLEELEALRAQFPDTVIVGISDSAFHATKPDYAWNYGISLRDADTFDIKRFGYHGLSVASVVQSLHTREKLPPRVIVCHLGSGVSVTALYHGKSFDTTMGYSPLEGVIMATRCGSIDHAAVRVLQQEMQLDDLAMQEYLNKQSGLLGLSGFSSDIRSLVEHENDSNHHAALALRTYVFTIQKAIGQMAAALGGADMLVFTGTIGERSFIMRERIVERLGYLEFVLDSRNNRKTEGPAQLTCISKLAHSRPVFVVPADETGEMLQHL